MQEFLTRMIGRRVDILCSVGVSLRGEVMKVEGGVLHLKDDEQLCYVAVGKIAVVWEARDDDQHRAGFVSGAIK